jgi:hypothetical protein
MCWWTEFHDRIKDVDDCRNLSAFIFQQYNGLIGEKLQSVINRNNVAIPHCINHHERGDFVAIIAAIVEEPPEMKEFTKSCEAAECLASYEPLYEDIRDSEIFAKIISIAVTKEGKTLPDHIDSKLRLFAAAVTASMREYKTQGEKGMYSIEYLYQILS